MGANHPLLKIKVMTEPQEFSSDFDLWVCSLLDMLRAKGYTNVSVNRGRTEYIFFCYVKRVKYGVWINGFRKSITIPYTQLQTDFKNNQTPQQILELIK